MHNKSLLNKRLGMNEPYYWNIIHIYKYQEDSCQIEIIIVKVIALESYKLKINSHLFPALSA